MLEDKKIKIIIFSLVVFFVLVGSVVVFFGLRDPAPEKIELEIWGVYDDSGAYKDLIRKFEEQYPHISINYRKKTYETYESGLLEAMATGRGPDIFMMENNWLPSYRNKVVPAPAEMISLNQVKNDFVDVVEKDFIENNKIYALPLFVDTLALYYNKDIFNTEGVAQPPRTWQEFMDVVEKVTVTDKDNNIVRAGAAMGTARNINRSTDIVSLLMLQSGADMVDDDRNGVNFDDTVTFQGESFNPGERALSFYTNFSNPLKSIYTWNRQMHYSLDAFYEGKVAMMFNYAYHAPTIRSKASYLNFDVAPMPQIAESEKDVNYANYWGFAVSGKSENPEEAWQFINWLTDKENAQIYLQETKRPTARRDLVNWQRKDTEIGVFAEQSLTAHSWYQTNPHAIEKHLANMIEAVVKGEESVESALNKAVSQINLLYR